MKILTLIFDPETGEVEVETDGWQGGCHAVQAAFAKAFGGTKKARPFTRSLVEVSRHSAVRDRGVERISKALDKKLDRVIAKTLRRRPRKGDSIIRPKTNGSETPFLSGIDHQQTTSTSVGYALPSWRKKLENQLPHSVRMTAKLHPIIVAIGTHPKDGHIILRAESELPLILGKPALNKRRNNERGSEPLPRGSRKERIVGKGMVRDNSLQETERSKKRRVSGLKRERLTV